MRWPQTEHTVDGLKSKKSKSEKRGYIGKTIYSWFATYQRKHESGQHLPRSL